MKYKYVNMNTANWDVFKGYQELDDETYLIKEIEDLSFLDSYNEIQNNFDKFSEHSQNPVYIKSGPLRECKSLFLTVDISPVVMKKEKTIEFTEISKKHFSKTILFLNFLKNSISTNSFLGRSYITILEPGNKIYPHCDTAAPYFNSINRYQFYYTGNRRVSQIIKNKKYKVSPGYFYHFDHRQIHEYINSSDTKLILMVFDIFK